MPSILLHCAICPKRPHFSDVSHLLTHVGSKGHLASLHSLQVRSHQELDAGRQLVLYNQWFQEHGVAVMLSERMQQKAQKRAEKIKDDQAGPCSEMPNTVDFPGRRVKRTMQTTAPPFSAYEALPPSLKFRTSDFTPDGLSCTPVPAPRQSGPPTLSSTPSKSARLSAAAGFPAEEDAHIRPPRGTPQLKGVHYPGMDLFDAAPQELQRKRNQKKDGSILKRLETNAALVRPTETVSSAGGIVLKHRHMDDLENDSPVEGEEIEMPRQSSPKRRRPGARAARVKMETRKPRRGPGRPRKQLQTPIRPQGSLVNEDTPKISHFAPTEDESREFELAVRDLRNRKRRANFAIYQDSSPSFTIDGASEVMPLSYTNITPSETQLAYPPPVWHGQQSETYDPLKLMRDRFTAYPTFEGAGYGKENIQQTGLNTVMANSMNPLFFHGVNNNPLASDSYAEDQTWATTSSNFDPFQDHDAFTPVRNPLMLALDHIKTPTKQEGFPFGGEAINFASQYRQPLFAP